MNLVVPTPPPDAGLKAVSTGRAAELGIEAFPLQTINAPDMQCAVFPYRIHITAMPYQGKVMPHFVVEWPIECDANDCCYPLPRLDCCWMQAHLEKSIECLWGTDMFGRQPSGENVESNWDIFLMWTDHQAENIELTIRLPTRYRIHLLRYQARWLSKALGWVGRIMWGEEWDAIGPFGKWKARAQYYNPVFEEMHDGRHR